MTFRLRTLACAVLLSFGLAHAAAPAPERWDLRDLYPTAAAWSASRDALLPRIDALPALREGFGRDAAALLQALSTISDLQREVLRLYVYASLQADEDLAAAPAQERKQAVLALYTRLGEKTAWVAPAVQALGAERVQALLAAEPALRERFDFYLDDQLRNQPHTLSPEAEAVLAASGTALSQPGTVFEQFVDNEMPRKSATLADGRRVEMRTDNYEKYRSSPRRDERKKVFDAFFGSFKPFEGTIGATLAASVQGDVFRAGARKFDDSLQASLFGDNMPPAVYRTLVEQANAGLPTLHRYLKLRQKALGIRGRLGYHDNYPPLVAPPKGVRFDLERSKAVTLQALAPMGDEYLAMLQRTLSSPWTDSHPRKGKPSGAYMAGAAYDVHPYMLLNHTDDYESLSTLAHEAGHAVHSLLSNAAQPFDKAGYSTFVAESASIANEMLLQDHMVASATTAAEKRYYLAQALESIRTTFFRQVMFAEFELLMHQEVEAGRPLSGERLSNLYCGIARRYYGQAEGVMDIDPAYCLEWAYIGHFYRGFYVWQYATSMVGAAQFADAIRRDGAPARERFITLLKSGNSGYAYPLYVKAGVDLAQPAPYQALMARMNRLMDEFERLAPAP